MGKLKDWGDKQSPFIRLSDGDSIVGQYLGFEFVPNRFDPKKQSVRYIIVVDGEEKSFESGSSSVAFQFDKIGENENVRISREGEGTKTKYQVEAVADAKISKKQADDINSEMAG